jgi:hypothetical protein
MNIRDETQIPVPVSESQLAYRAQWREMWRDYVGWMGYTIAGAVQGRSDLDQTTVRLLASCRAMREAMRPYCGDADAELLGDLMTFHATLAALMAVETRQGRLGAAAATETHWYDNATEIAVLLATINPNISEARLRDLLKEHLDLIKAEMSAHVEERDGGVADFEAILRQAEGISDVLADGIIEQFPASFT